MSNAMKTVLGFAVAWAASILLAFIAGCALVFLLFSTDGHTKELLDGLLAVNSDAVTVLFTVGQVVAAVGAVISAPAIVLIALPLYLVLGRHWRNSVVLCTSAGFVVAVIAAVIFLGWQYLYAPYPLVLVLFEAASILISGPIAALTFWLVRYRVLRETVEA